MREETASLTKVKEWATKYLPSDNELRDTILSEERETLPRWEASVKLDDYSRMLDSKARRMAETE